jgi:gamma-glutamyltranspeptidase/glutathione hydrolase
MNIQEALEAPRFTKLTFGGCDVLLESRIPLAVRERLMGRGHELQVTGDFSSQMGGGQVVLRDSKTGVNFAASSPRKDGAAVPEPAPYFAK